MHSLFNQVEMENGQNRGKHAALRNPHQLLRCSLFYYPDETPENTT